MLCWKCDVCSKLGESPTHLSQFRLMPEGWRKRSGNVPAKGGCNEVEVHVCSEKCAKLYDEAEAKEVGFVWQKSVVSDGPYKAGKNERPLKVARRPT